MESNHLLAAARLPVNGEGELSNLLSRSEVAKRMECVELAPAFATRMPASNVEGHSKAGASSTHSIRFATFGASRRKAAFKRIYAVLAFAFIVATPCPGAEQEGEQVVIVFNTRVPESKNVADYYAERRGVPTNQIFGFEVSTNEDFERSAFRDTLQRPLAKKLEQSKLWHIGSNIVPATSNQAEHVEWKVTNSKIRYLVLCYGIPLHIAKDPNLKEKGTENLRAELQRNEAAVDSELALLPMIEAGLPLAGPLRNPIYTTTNEPSLHPTNGILIVTRLDGPTAGIARGLVDKALEAEANGLWGRAYFDLRNVTDGALKAGDDWIRGAAELSRHLGFEVVIDENGGTFPASFPMSQIALYAGWYDESASGPFARPTVEFMPGAFAYHLHSFSAATLRSTTRNWVGPLLAKGVTATMGCADEPYLSGTPEIAIFIARWIFNRMNFGAAAYASQPVLSWMTTVVGDPLYRPFGKHPETLHQELTRSQSKLLQWSYLRLVNLNLANGKALADSVTFLEELPLTKQSPILSEKLGDLYTAQGKPSSAVYAYQQALKFEPSPQQRIRLMLELGEKLPPLDKAAEAYEIYEQFVKQFPEYPDKTNIIRKLLPLAQKLNKTADVEKYEAELKPK